MKFRLNSLIIDCLNEREEVTFTDFSYFHGPVGAGKSTIVKLIDFCLGGHFEPTPVLQPVFKGVSLFLSVNERDLCITRDRDSDKIRAQWDEPDGPIDLTLPARKPAGIVLPGSEVEVLSDLIFYLVGQKPPRVRKSKTKEDTELIRLSMRDLLWYCYLDQDSMDSSFFNLGDDANPFEKLKSLDVLRFIIGFHQEKVSELEVELVNLKNERMRCEAAAQAIREAFNEEQLSSTGDLHKAIAANRDEVTKVRAEIERIRENMGKIKNHAIESLRKAARDLSDEINEIEDAVDELQKSIERDKSHRNTLRGLALRQRRALFARAELSGLGFESCPQCYQKLPERPSELCPVCGQTHLATVGSAIDTASVEADAKVRADELDERVGLQTKTLNKFKRQLTELRHDKEQVDYDLNKASVNYDSAYLSSALELEKRSARLDQKIEDLIHLEGLAGKVAELDEKVVELEKKEVEVRAELKNERAEAERDRGNLILLEGFFLDCLLRIRLPGINATDKVEIRSPHFLPVVKGQDSGELVTTTFSNMSSGGKKNLFKCCFAVAVHRLAKKIGAMLPELLIIDSPMKNISERENNDQFVGFNEMLFEFADEELKGTQFIIVDKEYFPPKDGHSFAHAARRMTPNDPNYPPLLRSHVGAITE